MNKVTSELFENFLENEFPSLSAADRADMGRKLDAFLDTIDAD